MGPKRRAGQLLVTGVSDCRDAIHQKVSALDPDTKESRSFTIRRGLPGVDIQFGDVVEDRHAGKSPGLIWLDGEDRIKWVPLVSWS